ncbi:MAG: threonine dehydratase [Candidatus Glassbacteria bacterium]|nr:threonine dehydratase [Candidatus Glassbacteria bacterium]
MSLPALAQVRKARSFIGPYLMPTPLHRYPSLERLLGAEVHIKHENHHLVGAFKVRGGVYLVGTLPATQKRRGVIGATRGNHGQSLAYAGRLFGVKAVIVVPHGNNPEKNEAMRLLGAELIEHGRDFDEAVKLVEELTREHGYRYVHSANEPKLIAGVGTYSLEVFERLPDAGVMIVPVGLGSGISGACVVAEGLKKKTRLVGVQAEAASAVAQSWRSGKVVSTRSADTVADGLATRIPAEMTLEIMRRRVDEMVTVSEQEITEAVRLMIQSTHNLVEPAGACALAAALKIRQRLAGKKVVLVQTGANIDWATLRRIVL